MLKCWEALIVPGHQKLRHGKESQHNENIVGSILSMWMWVPPFCNMVAMHAVGRSQCTSGQLFGFQGLAISCCSKMGSLCAPTPLAWTLEFGGQSLRRSWSSLPWWVLMYPVASEQCFKDTQHANKPPRHGFKKLSVGQKFTITSNCLLHFSSPILQTVR